MINKLTKQRFIFVLTVAFLANYLIVLPASALSEGDYLSQGIKYYRAGVCVADSTPDTLKGGEAEEKIWNFFIGKGLTKKQVAGILGNMKVESPTLDPNKNQDGGGPGRGIVQWTVDGRWASLKKWAGSKDIYSLQTQLDYVWEELTNVPVWKDTLPPLKQTQTIKDATSVFMNKYERPNPNLAHFDRRLAMANESFGKFADSTTEIAAADQSAGESAQTNELAETSSDFCVDGQGSGSIVKIAQQELAKNVVEVPIGCDSANSSQVGDCGTEVNKYTDNRLEYWCADFVSWVYKQSGKPFTGGASAGGWRIPAVSSLRVWFEKNGTYTPNGTGVIPKPGDVYIAAGDEHTGIVEKVEPGGFYGISGNTSTDNYSNGVGVGRSQLIPIGSSSIKGFGRSN